MKAERLHIKLGLTGTYWSKHPEYRVKFNDDIIQHAEIKQASGSTEYLEFAVECTTETAVLSVELLNKEPTDTVENADKTGILHDMTLDVVSLEIDEIALDTLLHNVSEYRPNYPAHYSGDPVLRDCVTLGWNGVWSIRWTNPFYLWLLETM